MLLLGSSQALSASDLQCDNRVKSLFSDEEFCVSRGRFRIPAAPANGVEPKPVLPLPPPVSVPSQVPPSPGLAGPRAIESLVPRDPRNLKFGLDSAPLMPPLRPLPPRQ